jgi:hypothetical protein
VNKKIKMTLRELRCLIEARINEEDEQADAAPFTPSSGEEELGDSIDAQIDRLLNGYETEARNSKNEGLDFRALTRRFLSEEAVEAPEATEKKTLDDFDVESFANSVANLIENIDSLIETRNTIMRRAVNHLTETCDQSVIESFQEAMREQHGLAVGKSSQDLEDEVDVPPAERAGPALPGDVGGAP